MHNPAQIDTDNNGEGDSCAVDIDGDGMISLLRIRCCSTPKVHFALWLIRLATCFYMWNKIVSSSSKMLDKTEKAEVHLSCVVWLPIQSLNDYN